MQNKLELLWYSAWAITLSAFCVYSPHWDYGNIVGAFWLGLLLLGVMGMAAFVLLPDLE